jgi:hypothetical protein
MQAACPHAEIAFKDRGDKPATAPQRDIIHLGNRTAILRDDLRQPVAAQHRGGAIIAGARFRIDRLHAGPQGRRKRQPEKQHRELEGPAAPMRQERAQCRCQHQAIFPA